MFFLTSSLRLIIHYFIFIVKILSKAVRETLFLAKGHTDINVWLAIGTLFPVTLCFVVNPDTSVCKPRQQVRAGQGLERQV